MPIRTFYFDADPDPDPDPCYFVKDTREFLNFFNKRKTKHFLLPNFDIQTLNS